MSCHLPAPVTEVTLSRAGLDVLETNRLLIEGFSYGGITSIKSLLFRMMNYIATLSWFSVFFHVITTAKYNIAPSCAIPKILEKYTKNKFHENLYSGNRVVPCGQIDGQTVMTKFFFTRFCESAHKSQ